MKKVRILTPHSLGGGRDVMTGELVELPDYDAAVKVSQGRAEYYVEREPEVAHREPSRRRRGGDPEAEQ